MLLAAAVCTGIPLCGKKCGKVGKNVYCVVFAAAFAVISALRFRVGSYYAPYDKAYESFLAGDSGAAEAVAGKGMLLMMKMLCPIFPDSTALFVCTSVIIYFSVLGLIYKNSGTPWISVCAFICSGAFFDSMCFLRQFIAALICAYAIKNVCCGSAARFFILTAAASVFHSFAAIMAVMYFLLLIRPTAVYLAVVAVLTALFCVFYPAGMAYISERYEGLAAFLPTAGKTVTPVCAAVFGVIFLICFIFRKRLAKRDPRSAVYLNCMMFAAAFEAMAVRCGGFSQLAMLLYLPPLLYLIPELTKAMGEYFAEKGANVLKWFAYGALMTFAFGSFTYFMLFDRSGTVPYVTYFEKQYYYPDEFQAGADGTGSIADV